MARRRKKKNPGSLAAGLLVVTVIGGIWYLKKQSDEEEAKRKKKAAEKKTVTGAERMGLTLNANCTRLRVVDPQLVMDAFTVAIDTLQTAGQQVTPYTVVGRIVEQYDLPCPSNPQQWTNATPTKTKLVWSVLYLAATGILESSGTYSEQETDIAMAYLLDVLREIDYTEQEWKDATGTEPVALGS